MVDYSKWDKMASELDEEDDENNDNQDGPRQVRTTKFDKPQQITIGDGNYSVIKSKDESKPLSQSDIQPNLASAATILPQSHHNGEKMMKELGWFRVETNGTLKYQWRQTAGKVYVFVPVPDTVRSKDISVDMTTANPNLDSKDPQQNAEDLVILSVQLKTSDQVFFKTQLGYPTKPLSADDFVDWSIQTLDESRGVQIEFEKKELIPGAIFWWPKLCPGDPEINIDEIPGRTSQQNHSFREVWREAHEMFKEKVEQMKQRQEASHLDDGEA